MRRRSLVLLLLLLPTLATAQTPTPADTIRPDSALVTADSGLLTQDTVLADSLRPAPHLPDFPEPDSAAFWSGTWSWDREDLLRFQGTSLLELLVRVPGLGIVRAGGFGQPAGLSPFALGGGRTRLFVDGWEMDPLNSAVFDLQKLSLVDIESLRVERRLHELRIRVTTFRLADSRPFSQVDAATGDPETRYLRGLYSQRIGGRSILTLGFDLTDTDGFFSGESFGVTTGIARWGFLIDPRAGLQVELRQADVERATRFVDRGRRRDLLVRGRWNPTDALSLAAVAGRVTRAPEERDRFEAAEVSQLGLRSFLRLPAGVWMEGDLRLRSVSAAAFPAARSDLSLAAGVRPTALLELRGEARAARVAGEQGGEFLGGARFGPVRGISFFGSMTLGGRAVGILRADTIVPLRPDSAGAIRLDTFPTFGAIRAGLGGLRAGAEWSPVGGSAGIAVLHLDPERVVPFALFDADSVPPTATEASTGIEAYAALPLRRALRLEGWYTRWLQERGRPYLPEEEARVAIEFHRLYYTGNLEPTVRLALRRRGASPIPRALADGSGALLTDPFTLLDFFLQLRIIDVRVFVFVDNLLNFTGAAEIPGRPLPGARVLYGVKWFFRN